MATNRENRKVKINRINIINKGQLNVLEGDSALTWEGLCTDIGNLRDTYKWIIKHTGFKDRTKIDFYITSGKVMNSAYHLTGDNAYPDDLNIVSVKLADLENPLAVALPRFEVGGRWFDDIVANNARRQIELDRIDDEEGCL